MVGVISTIATTFLTIIFAIGGAAGAVACAWVGIQLISSNALSSAHGGGRAMMALVGVIGGVVLVLAGPQLADEVVKAMAGIPHPIPVPAF
jgi:hypothetical protein